MLLCKGAIVVLRGILRLKLTPSQVLIIGFLVLIIVGAFLLQLPNASRGKAPLSLLDVLFTATSAVCITGLTVVDTGTQFTEFGQFIIIMLVQIGGLGIMTFSTLAAIILGRKIGLKERLLIQESFNQISMYGLVKLIKNVLLLTFSFELLGGLILSICFLRHYPPGQALAFGFFHAVSAFCNAGFDLFGQVSGPFTSLVSYTNDWIVNLTIGGLLITGGLGFPVIVELFNYSSTGKLSLHSKLVLIMTFSLIIIGAVLIFFFEFNNINTMAGLDWPHKILSALFQSVSLRSSGFSTMDISQFRVSTWIIFIIFMFIGASPSSTGGGIKTTTFGLLLAAVIATIRGREDAEILERRIPKDLVYKALTIVMLALGWVAMVSLVISLVEPYSFIKLFFETISAFSTAGLSTGITPTLTVISKSLIIITMFIGRIGFFTVMVALLKNADSTKNKYIEERVIIG